MDVWVRDEWSPFRSVHFILHQRPNGGDRSFPFTHTYLFSSLYPFVSSLDSSHTRRERNESLLSLSLVLIFIPTPLSRLSISEKNGEMLGWDERDRDSEVQPREENERLASPTVSLSSLFLTSNLSQFLSWDSQRSGNVPIIKGEFLHLRDEMAFMLIHHNREAWGVEMMGRFGGGNEGWRANGRPSLVLHAVPFHSIPLPFVSSLTLIPNCPNPRTRTLENNGR